MWSVFNLLFVCQEQTVGQALDIVNEKMADVEEAEAKALTEVREYYNTCMERLRIRMNALGLLFFYADKTFH